MVNEKTVRRGINIGDRIFGFLVWLILMFTTLAVMLPMLHILSASFSSPAEVIKGIYFWPRDLSLAGYKAVFTNSIIMTAYKNTIIYVLVGAPLNTILTIFAAFPLSRKNLPGKNTIMFLFSFTMLFSGGLIPTFMVVNSLKLINTIWALVLVNAVSVWLLIVTRTFFETTIPVELYDSASIDGCNDFVVLFRIVIPLSKAIISVNMLMYAVGYWNSYYNAVVYLKDSDLMPLQVVLRNIMLSSNLSIDMMSSMDTSQYNMMQQLQYLLKYSCIIVATVPMLIFYPFIQKYFVKGIMIGSIKG